MTERDGKTIGVMLSAGEVSGDAHAAHALEAFRALPVNADRTITAFGMGGESLASAGCELVVDQRELSVIGFVDVLLNYHRFLARLARLRRALRERRPELLVIVDYPDFNLKLADTARELGIPVLMYVAPQVWAWRAGRIPDIVRRVSHLAVLFPFEQRLWREAGAQATCVGHPMVATLPAELDQASARKRLEIAADARVVALLPGSRRSEISRLAPLMAGVATQLEAERTGTVFVLPRATGIEPAPLQAALALEDAPPIRVLGPDEHASALAVVAADLAIVASGTATLETGWLGTPMLVVYRVAPLNYALMKRLIRIRDIALVNIVAEQRLVPEFVQDEATVARVAEAASRLLDDPSALQAMRSSLATIRDRLGQGDPSARVAALMQQLLSEPRPVRSTR